MTKEKFRKLVSVLTTFESISEASKKANLEVLEELELQRILYIHYLVQFGRFFIETFIDSDQKINAMQPSFASKVDFHICKTDVSALIIDCNRVENYEMVTILF